VTTYIKKIRAGLVPNASVQTFVGDPGTIFYDPAVGTLYLSDGVNPGGTALVTAGGGGLSMSNFGRGFVNTLDAGKITTSKLYNRPANLALNNHFVLEVTNGGVVMLPDQSSINGATLKTVAGNYAGITAGPASPAGKDEDSWVWVDNNGATIATKYSTDANTWTFDNDGGLTFPQGTRIATADGTDAFIIDGAVDKDVQIYTYSGPTPTAHGWTFGADGTLTTPDFWRVGSGNTSISNDGFANSSDLWLRAGDALFISTDLEFNGQLSDSQWMFSGKNFQLPPGGDIVDSTGTSVLGGSPDGGLADNSAGLTITTYSLSTSQYDTSGSVTYNIVSAGASAAGIIIKGLTVNHTQVISGSFNQGSNTVNWNDYTISGTLWNQVASVTAFVTDSRGYTFLALVTDMWEVPHGPCLVEGTLITMADGTHRTIEDIAHGELIRVWNFDLGEFSEAQPIWIKLAEETDMHDVYTFSDGTKLRTVGHHVFNKEAGAFTKFIEDTTPVGTTTFNEQGLEVILVSKERVVAPTRYYNIWTQYHLNLFANGILTSNRFNNIYPIVDMKFVKDDRALRSVDEFASIDEKYITGLRLQEQSEEYTAEYIADYVHNRLERLDIANQVEQGI